MSKLDRYIGGGVLMATLGVLLLLVGLDALTSVIDETDDIGDGYVFSISWYTWVTPCLDAFTSSCHSRR